MSIMERFTGTPNEQFHFSHQALDQGDPHLISKPTRHQ